VDLSFVLLFCLCSIPFNPRFGLFAAGINQYPLADTPLLSILRAAAAAATA
jgi:hypothetical protein